MLANSVAPWMAGKPHSSWQRHQHHSLACEQPLAMAPALLPPPPAEGAGCTGGGDIAAAATGGGAEQGPKAYPKGPLFSLPAVVKAPQMPLLLAALKLVRLLRLHSNPIDRAGGWSI